MYNVVASGPERRFEITGGLQEGYGGLGTLHTLENVVAAHHEWQRTVGIILGCTVAACTVSYGWPEGDTVHGASEPGFILSGALNVQYTTNVADSTALHHLSNLAACLAEHLAQERMYFSFRGQAYILEREGAVLPYKS